MVKEGLSYRRVSPGYDRMPARTCAWVVSRSRLERVEGGPGRQCLHEQSVDDNRVTAAPVTLAEVMSDDDRGPVVVYR